MTITNEAVYAAAKAACVVLNDNGMPVFAPDEGSQDDVERERWLTVVAALEAAEPLLTAELRATNDIAHLLIVEQEGKIKSLRAKLARLEAAAGRAEKAIAPMANAVSNDNGDITLEPMAIGSDAYMEAYWARRALRDALIMSEKNGRIGEKDDKIDGLQSDLDSALDVLWRRGDNESRVWVWLNYPQFASRQKEPASGAFKFAIGQRVEKVGGSYQLSGEIAARWLTDKGEPRYVVNHKPIAPGLLHIYGEAQLREMALRVGFDAQTIATITSALATANEALEKIVAYRTICRSADERDIVETFGVILGIARAALDAINEAAPEEKP